MASFVDLYENALHVELGTSDTSQLFTGARRKHAINEGYRQFADLTECYIRQSTIAISTSAQEYNLNATSVIPSGDFLRVASQQPYFQINDSNGILITLAGDQFPQVSIPYLDHADPSWRSTNTAYPDGWYLRDDGGGMFFGLQNRLDLSTGSTQTAKVVLPYVAKPSSMTSDTAVPFTSSNGLTRHDLQPYHQAIAHYAAHDLEKLRKDQEASDRQLKKFQGYVQRYLDAHRPKGNRVVRMAVPYFQRARKGGWERGGVLTPWWYR